MSGTSLRIYFFFFGFAFFLAHAGRWVLALISFGSMIVAPDAVTIFRFLGIMIDSEV